jgi:protein-disulfide isomerase
VEGVVVIIARRTTRGVQRPAATSVQAPARAPAGATPERDGIVLGDGPATVDAYIDFLCPFCRQFEERAGPTLDRLVAERSISLVYHPLGFLDRLSTTRYSSRAAAASGCASDQARFLQYKDVLFANQPPEGGPGLSDAELIALGQSAGITEPGFGRCVSARIYLPWVEYVTARAAQQGVSGTPSVFVQGVAVPPYPDTISAAVALVLA